ncbi:MAG: EutN/CcmL family microcompartment protein [Thermoplasmata archaeon]
MYIGKVIGTVVCTQKDPGLEGYALLVVQPLNDDMTPKGKPVVALDTLKCAGPGEFVYVVKSREAALPTGRPLVPVDAGIVGIIDDYFVEPYGKLSPDKTPQK